ncbi:unnamed protein product [Durusdinium trenchii]|uniref:BRO1 domain-containing protein n=2 Tax=Durusdinium trenchii TaxID=1381693 RepID=A0ABP0HE15_9DINO
MEIEEVHFAGSPLDQYLKEVGCDLGCTVEAPKAKMEDAPQAPKPRPLDTHGREVAKEIAKLCESCCLLSPDASAAAGFGNRAGTRESWPWLLPLNLTLGFSFFALWRRRGAGFPSWFGTSAAVCLVASCCQSVFLFTRASLWWEARATCKALLWLFEEADAAVQLLRSLELEAEETEGGLRLSAIAADFYAAAETQARQLCARLSLPGAESQTIPGAPPGAHAGAARLRLAFARAWQLQEASLLVALRSCAAGRLNDARIEMKSLRRMVEESARCLRRQLAYAESCKATICGAQRGARDGSGPNGPGGLGARVSLSLALATFSQGIKRRHEVLHSPEAYNAWLQDLIGRLEAHLDDLSKTEHPKLPGGNDEAPVEVANPPAKPVSKGKILEEAGYTVLHEALGGCASRPRVTSNVQLSQEEEMQLRRDSRSAWRSCVEELQGKLETKSGAARLWQQRQERSSKIARVCDDDELQAWGDLPPPEEGVRPSRRWRPSAAQQELMQALCARLDGRASDPDVLEG